MTHKVLIVKQAFNLRPGQIEEYDSASEAEGVINSGLGVSAEGMIRLHLVTSLVGHGFSYNPGDRIERPFKEAARLMEAGFAIPAIEPVEQATAPEAQDLETRTVEPPKPTRQRRASKKKVTR